MIALNPCFVMEFNTYMNTNLCLKFVGIGAIALGVTMLLSQPSLAKKKVTVTTSPGSTSRGSATVVPTVPVGQAGPVAPGPTCGPQMGMPCVQPPRPMPIAQDYFFCGQSSHRTPTTFVSTPTGNIPLIRWVSHYFAGSGYDPQTRCEEVSQRFNQFYRQGQLNYITTGIVNQLPVVCISSEIGGPCTGVLLTLKPREDAARVVQQLFDVRAGASGPLFESATQPYIDLKQLIQERQAVGSNF